MSEWIWQPTPEFARATNVWRYMQRLGFSDREEFLRYSVDNLTDFWGDLAVELSIEWFAPFTKVLDASRGVEWARWYIGAKLNIASNTLDRHVRGVRANRTAIVSESEDGTRRELTFAELAREVNQAANALRELDLQPGDRVALVMPMVADVVTVLYACFKLGLVPVLIFAGFGVGAIESRLRDSGARVVFTASHLTRRGKRLSLVEKVREAAANCPAVEHIFEELPRGSERHCASMPMDSEAPALMLYTSGTTGKPKGVVHTHAGALIQTAKEIYLAFDHQDSDRFFWLSDIGWMMGPWSIIGNHHFGGTIFMYDGAPDWPDPDRLWRTLERERITTFGVSPTLIRALMRSSDPSKFDLSALRLLGSTGEPWDDVSYRWFFEQIGGKRCPIINISGGTEIIGCFLFPLPIQPLKSCTLGAPAPGMAAEVVNSSGQPVRGETGHLVCTKPAPSMTRGIWRDPERYLKSYWSRFPGWWDHGDWASVDSDGCWFLHGRADESMNVAGRKVGPAEVEDALTSHPAVSEAAVIGVPDEVKGEAIV
ncbi:AMP-binding protein, partial [Nevskia soli]|uniref:AMP-binding protein n=1 Tax=Nevskia soli TaxID=418856 RepID=UPI0015D91A60